jgi:hypothetical protein
VANVGDFRRHRDGLRGHTPTASRTFQLTAALQVDFQLVPLLAIELHLQSYMRTSALHTPELEVGAGFPPMRGYRVFIQDGQPLQDTRGTPGILP